MSLCFNGATDFHQWKYCVLLMLMRSSGTCFNGATDFHQWKSIPPTSTPTPTATASMGPLIFISGNKANLSLHRLTTVGFNGATDFHQWKL